MVVTKKNLLMASASVALAVNFSACKKDKNDSQTDKLVGEWEVITVEGDPVEEGYTYTFKFEADQDFSLCYEEVGYPEYCYNGEWEWTNDDEDEVDMTITYYGYGSTLTLEIDELSNDVLEGDLLDQYGDRFPVTMEKQ